MSIVLSAAFLLGVWGFCKKYNLADLPALGITFAFGLVVAVLPQVSASFPSLQPWLQTVLDYLGLFVGVFGNQTTLTLGSQKVAQHFGFLKAK